MTSISTIEAEVRAFVTKIEGMLKGEATKVEATAASWWSKYRLWIIVAGVAAVFAGILVSHHSVPAVHRVLHAAVPPPAASTQCSAMDARLSAIEANIGKLLAQQSEAPAPPPPAAVVPVHHAKKRAACGTLLGC